jgi:hypothetical protein
LARYNASRLRNDPRVKDRINELLQEHADRTAIKVEWVQNKIAPFLEIDPADLYEASASPENPTKLELKPLTALPERVRKAITRIRIDPMTGRPVEIFLVDKLAAANTLLRSLPGGQDEGAKVAAAAIVEVRWREPQGDLADNSVVAQAMTRAQMDLEPVRGDAVARLKALSERSPK